MIEAKNELSELMATLQASKNEIAQLDAVKGISVGAVTPANSVGLVDPAKVEEPKPKRVGECARLCEPWGRSMTSAYLRMRRPPSGSCSRNGRCGRAWRCGTSQHGRWVPRGPGT